MVQGAARTRWRSFQNSESCHPRRRCGLPAAVRRTRPVIRCGPRSPQHPDLHFQIEQPDQRHTHIEAPLCMLHGQLAPVPAHACGQLGTACGSCLVLRWLPTHSGRHESVPRRPSQPIHPATGYRRASMPPPCHSATLRPICTAPVMPAGWPPPARRYPARLRPVPEFAAANHDRLRNPAIVHDGTRPAGNWLRNLRPVPARRFPDAASLPHPEMPPALPPMKETQEIQLRRQSAAALPDRPLPSAAPPERLSGAKPHRYTDHADKT